MAVLLGRQASSDGAAIGGHAGGQGPVDGATTVSNNQTVRSLGEPLADPGASPLEAASSLHTPVR
jgi:hypothetical protein